MMKTARAVVQEALLRLEQDKGYSNLVLDALLQKYKLSAADRSFATRLFYGVLERKLTLDYVAEQYCKQPPQLAVRIILWMGLYQLVYMQVPESAAVNESVKLAAVAKPGTKGFINAVLRQFLRDGGVFSLPKGEEPAALSIRYSCPEWLVRQYIVDYGVQKTLQILETSLLPPPVTIRANLVKGTCECLMERLREEGISSTPVRELPGCLMVDGNPIDTACFREGLFHIQDIASQLCSLVAVDGHPRTVLDLCAAPGGKSFTMAEQLAENGQVRSFDLHSKRVKLIQDGAKRLALDNLVAEVGDASRYNPVLGEANCVLCDVPCSGLGVIRRKPEIKYKDSKQLAGLPEIQKKILENGARYVKLGGRLVYSTCSLSKKENEEVTEDFLNSYPAFAPDPLPDLPYFERDGHAVTMFPDVDGPDGFYIATFRRMR